MKNLICGYLLLSVMALSPDSTSSKLDGSYAPAIQQALKALGHPQREGYLRQMLEGSTHEWKKASGYAEVRKKIESIQNVRRQFRLEIGNVNAGGYGVIWAVEDDSGVTVFSNVFSAHQLISGHVTQVEWEKFLSLLAQHRHAINCKSDLSVDDGSSLLRIDCKRGDLEYKDLWFTGLFHFRQVQLIRSCMRGCRPVVISF